MSKFVDIYVPPHLYGQLAQHKDGLDMLLDSGDIDGLMTVRKDIFRNIRK